MEGLDAGEAVSLNGLEAVVGHLEGVEVTEAVKGGRWNDLQKVGGQIEYLEVSEVLYHIIFHF